MSAIGPNCNTKARERTGWQHMTGGRSWEGVLRDYREGLLPANIQEMGHDLVAALAVAAVAIPEQIATAGLAGMPATTGLLVFVAGSIGFYLLGSNRFLSVGADSTIAPIFAASLALLATSGTPHYITLCAMFALLVGSIVVAGGAFRMGWIARLLSVPVITGFLAGIAIHIVVSQLPALLGTARRQGDLFNTVSAVVHNIPHSNPITLAIGISVFAITFFCEKVDKRLPGGLIAMILASLVVWSLELAGHGVATLGIVQLGPLEAGVPHLAYTDIVNLVPLALIVALVVIIQTAATSRSFPDAAGGADINRDLLGVGFGSILSGVFGGFPANSSPPRTAVVAESGGRSRLAGLCAAMIVAIFLAFGLRLLVAVPLAALAGLLMFVAQRIFRFDTIRKVAEHSRGEFALLLVTAAVIVAMPIAIGVGIGIALSLLHGVWTITQTRAVSFEQVAGSTVWWPASQNFKGATRPGIVVVGFQAPLFFLNAETFRKSLGDAVLGASQPVHAIILEASSIMEIDFTGAQTLAATIRFWKDRGVDFYVARLESLRAQQAIEKYNILPLLAAGRTFHSVDEAMRRLGT
jgi:sulfate permease, SulP family